MQQVPAQAVWCSWLSPCPQLRGPCHSCGATIRCLQSSWSYYSSALQACGH